MRFNPLNRVSPGDHRGRTFSGATFVFFVPLQTSFFLKGGIPFRLCFFWGPAVDLYSSGALVKDTLLFYPREPESFEGTGYGKFPGGAGPPKSSPPEIC